MMAGQACPAEDATMTNRSRCRSPRSRALRWGWLVLALPTLWACGSSTTTTSATSSTYTAVFSGKHNNNLDLLFMIDNSPMPISAS